MLFQKPGRNSENLKKLLKTSGNPELAFFNKIHLTSYRQIGKI